MSDGNRKGLNGDKIMTEVVALECWHGALDPNRAAELCSHVGFKPGQFTTTNDYGAVTFTVKITEARLLLVVPPNEPVRIDRGSIFAGTDAAEVEHTTEVKKHSSREASASGELGFESCKVQASGKLGAGGKAGSSVAQKTAQKTKSGPIAVRCWKDSAGYAWLFTPSGGVSLNGEPWRRGQPVARFKRTDSAGSKLDAAIYLEVRTKREHINIEVIGVIRDKGNSLGRFLANLPRNKLAAAEACIRNALIAEGLEVDGFDDPNAYVTLARVQAADESS
jgi:hypothetical protein